MRYWVAPVFDRYGRPIQGPELPVIVLGDLRKIYAENDLTELDREFPILILDANKAYRRLPCDAQLEPYN